jgi:hypothetical protein
MKRAATVECQSRYHRPSSGIHGSRPPLRSPLASPARSNRSQHRHVASSVPLCREEVPEQRHVVRVQVSREAWITGATALRAAEFRWPCRREFPKGTEAACPLGNTLHGAKRSACKRIPTRAPPARTWSKGGPNED